MDPKKICYICQIFLCRASLFQILTMKKCVGMKAYNTMETYTSVFSLFNLFLDKWKQNLMLHIWYFAVCYLWRWCMWIKLWTFPCRRHCRCTVNRTFAEIYVRIVYQWKKCNSELTIEFSVFGRAVISLNSTERKIQYIFDICMKCFDRLVHFKNIYFWNYVSNSRSIKSTSIIVPSGP